MNNITESKILTIDTQFDTVFKSGEDNGNNRREKQNHQNDHDIGFLCEQEKNENLDKLQNDLDYQLDQVPQQNQQITAILKHLQHIVDKFQDTDYVKYGYHQYQIAKKCLSRHSNLTEQQRNRYTRERKNHKNDHDDYIAQQAQLIVNERKKNEGPGLLSQVSRVVSYLIKNIPRREVTKAVFQAVSPVYSIFESTKEVSILATISKACVSKLNLLFLAGIVVVEAGIICYQYQKDKDMCNKEVFKNELYKIIKQQKMEALGVRTVSSFVINSTSAIAGATIGALFSPVGSIKGGVMGVIIGAISSYQVDKRLINPYFLENKDFLNNAYEVIGLELFEKIAKRPFTQEEFEQKAKRCLIYEHPDKFESEDWKNNARINIFQIRLAIEIIKKERGWDQTRNDQQRQLSKWQ